MGWDGVGLVTSLCSAFWFRYPLAYVPCYGNRKYVATLAHALDILDATLADDPCYDNRAYVAALAHALVDTTLADVSSRGIMLPA